MVPTLLWHASSSFRQSPFSRRRRPSLPSCQILLLLTLTVAFVFLQDTNHISMLQRRPSGYVLNSIVEEKDEEARNYKTKNATVLVFPAEDSLSATAATAATPPGRLFYCGWNSVPALLFPEYDFQEQMWNPAINNNDNSSSFTSTNSNDVLVVGMYGPCLGERRFFAHGGPARIYELFAGKILYINGEAYGHLDSRVIDREYQIGPPSSSSSSLPATTLSKRASNRARTRASKSMTILTTTPEKQQPDNFRQVYFVAVCLGMIAAASQTQQPTTTNDSTSSIRDWILDPTQRRINTGKYSGVAYYASHCQRFRQRAASQISEVVPVYFGKGCKVDPLKPPAETQQRRSNYTNAIKLLEGKSRIDWQQNHQFLHDFKYCLAMENRDSTGYITEKLLNAFLAGCLPIYYGTREVWDIFNENSFLFYDIHDPQSTLDRIRYLEDHPTAYMDMLQAPILKNGTWTIEQYFSIYPDIGNGTLNREIREMMGLPMAVDETK